MNHPARLAILAALTVSIGCAKAEMAPESAADSAAEVTNEEITNNQEEGVDEGGIVKNIGDHLVVLRNGWLYAVDVGQAGEMHQDAATRVAPHDDPLAWLHPLQMLEALLEDGKQVVHNGVLMRVLDAVL